MYAASLNAAPTVEAPEDKIPVKLDSDLSCGSAKVILQPKLSDNKAERTTPVKQGEVYVKATAKLSPGQSQDRPIPRKGREAICHNCHVKGHKKAACPSPVCACGKAGHPPANCRTSGTRQADNKSLIDQSMLATLQEQQGELDAKLDAIKIERQQIEDLKDEQKVTSDEINAEIVDRAQMFKIKTDESEHHYAGSDDHKRRVVEEIFWSYYRTMLHRFMDMLIYGLMLTCIYYNAVTYFVAKWLRFLFPQDFQWVCDRGFSPLRACDPRFQEEMIFGASFYLYPFFVSLIAVAIWGYFGWFFVKRSGVDRMKMDKIRDYWKHQNTSIKLTGDIDLSAGLFMKTAYKIPVNEQTWDQWFDERFNPFADDVNEIQSTPYLTMPVYRTMCFNNVEVADDLRDKRPLSMSMSKMVFPDPQRATVTFSRLCNGVMSESVERIISVELFMQLSDPTIINPLESVETIKFRLNRKVQNLHSVNVSRFDVLDGENVYMSTAACVFFLYEHNVAAYKRDQIQLF
jgi:hypothetical protein